MDSFWGATAAAVAAVAPLGGAVDDEVLRGPCAFFVLEATKRRGFHPEKLWFHPEKVGFHQEKRDFTKKNDDININDMGMDQYL